MDMRRSVRKHLALRLLLEERQRRLAKLGDVLSGEAREEMQVLVQCGGGRSRRHGHASRRAVARAAASEDPADARPHRLREDAQHLVL